VKTPTVHRRDVEGDEQQEDDGRKTLKKEPQIAATRLLIGVVRHADLEEHPESITYLNEQWDENQGQFDDAQSGTKTMDQVDKALITLGPQSRHGNRKVGNNE
jgi:hypothetical protein